MTTDRYAEERRELGFAESGNPRDSLGVSRDGHGQHYPQHYPQPADPLGEPLTIRQVAELLGCSDWTVRHSYVPRGLPHLRSRPLGKLIFYRNQVVWWVLQQQRKGGM